MPQVTFRRATAADLETIVVLLADDPLGAQREDITLPLNPRYIAAFEAIDTDPNQLLAVVEHDDAIVGCLQLSFMPGLSRLGQWRGQIESVRIAAARRIKACSASLFTSRKSSTIPEMSCQWASACACSAAPRP